MTTRPELQDYLERLLGSRHVYYQPPETLKLVYPAIVYERTPAQNRYSGDSTYIHYKSYDITVISRDPDIEAVETLRRLPYCRYKRHFTSDNLYHDVFTYYLN